MSFFCFVNILWFVLYLIVCDVLVVIVFYCNVFGFGVQDEVYDYGCLIYVEMIYQGQFMLMFVFEGVFGFIVKVLVGVGFECLQSFYLYCDDVDIVYQNVFDQGVMFIMVLYDVFWGECYVVVCDFDGYCWGFVCWLVVV